MKSKSKIESPLKTHLNEMLSNPIGTLVLVEIFAGAIGNEKGKELAEKYKRGFFSGAALENEFNKLVLLLNKENYLK